MVNGKTFQPHPLVVKALLDEQPCCEAVESIRHVRVELAKGGPTPVCFIDAPTPFPSLFSQADAEPFADDEKALAVDFWGEMDDDWY